MDRLRVAHVITKLELGGAQQNTLATVGRLDPKRFDVCLIAGPGGYLDEEARASIARFHVAPHLIRDIHPLNDLRALAELTRFLIKEKPDIVHTHSSKAGILGRQAAWLARVPVIIHTYHGFGFHPRQSAVVRSFYIAAEKLCGIFTDRLIFVSKANWAEAERLGLGRADRYVLIRSGVRLSDFPAKIADKLKKKAELGLGMHKPLVLSVGNLKPQKNPEDFLKLASAVLQGYPDARFAFIGDGPLKTKIEAGIIREKLHGKVAFLGWRRDTAEIMAAADVFVLTSLWEGLPRALVEAMKTGLACACYAVDGVTDVLKDGETGFTVPAGDWRGLAAKVGRLLKDEELRRRMGENASRAIGVEFDIDEMVRRQEELYLGLARRRPQ